MGGDRYVLLGLAHPRAPWSSEVARWATSGAAPIELVKCMSATDVATRLNTARSFSAVLLDESVAGVDRDLIELARRRDCPVIVVGSGASSPQWHELGAATTLPSSFDRAPLLDALATHAQLVQQAEVSGVAEVAPAPETPWRGRLVAVVGAGGTGASTVAMALAQGLADDVRDAGQVVLADFARRADLAMFHDVPDLVPGVPELVEAHRHRRPGTADVRSLTFDIRARRYQLLLGLRRHRDWTALRPRAFEAALDSLRASFHVVVADIDSDFEGDRETGSADVEDRNLMARVVAASADLVVLVGELGLKGTFAFQRLASDARTLGVDRARLLPVLNQAPRSARARAEHARAVAHLSGQLGISAPLPLPHRRGLDQVQRSAERLPDTLSGPLAKAVRALLLSVPEHRGITGQPERVLPGSLGMQPHEETAP